jgi:two-component system cell cycle response regulator
MLHFAPGSTMTERALIVEEAGVVAATLRAQLEAAGFEVDVAPEARALAAQRSDHALAVVRGERRELAAALKIKDPSLSVALLFWSDDALAAHPPAPAAADGVLVGPLAAAAVAVTARTLARLTAQAREAARRARGGAAATPGLDLHRRLVLMEVKRARRYRYPLGVALVAIDGWRDVASPLAPGGRAQLLGEVLALVARSLRDVDLPVLHADERFLVLMPHTPPDAAALVASRLCQRIAAHPGPPALAASAGVACFEGDGPVSLGSLITEAARGLEHARSLGGGRAERGAPARRGRKVDLGC